MKRNKFPYLIDQRLERVLAAIQILGSYEWASREVSSWSEKLENEHEKDDWLQVFYDHPEFFRISSDGYVSLRWRHGYDRIYSVKDRKELSPQEIKEYKQQTGAEKLSRKPLTPEQIAGLMNTAIELHNGTIARRRERRWFAPLIFPVLGAMLGGIVVAAVQTYLG